MSDIRTKPATDSYRETWGQVWGQVSCEGCGGLCCRGAVGVYPTDAIFTDDSLVKVTVDKGYPKEMRMDADNRCMALVDGKCSIHDKRPWECRAFEAGCDCCLLFRKGRLTEHSCHYKCHLVGLKKESV